MESNLFVSDFFVRGGPKRSQRLCPRVVPTVGKRGEVYGSKLTFFREGQYQFRAYGRQGHAAQKINSLSAEDKNEPLFWSIIRKMSMKNGQWMALAIAVISFFPCFVSCKKENALWKGKTTEENGVIVVRNPAKPMLGKDACFVEEDLSIGSPGSEEEQAFSEIAGVAVDREENIYVLDSKEAHIQVFNKAGIYLRTIGKKGQGPGEMQRPINISITPGNEILVNDRGARFLHFFALGGEHQRSISLARIQSFSRPLADSGNNILARFGTFMPDRVSFVLAKFDPRLKQLFPVFSYDYDNSPNIYDVFPPDCFWAVGRDDNIIWGYSDKYELNILNKDGRLVRRIIRDYAPVKTTDDEKKDWIKFAFGNEGVPPEVKVKWPSYHNAFRSLIVDDSGRIIVETYEKAADERGFYYDVFDPEGRYLARILLNAAPRSITKDKLYTIEEVEKGYQEVKRYSVTWGY